MTGGPWVQPRRMLLTTSAAAAVLVGHGLDALGLLPGVAESAAVRTAVLAPGYDAAALLGAVVVALGADLLLRSRRRTLALGCLVAGQTALLWLPEALGRQEAGEGEQWATVSTAVAVQVVLAAVAVGLALLCDAVLLRARGLRPSAQVPAVSRCWLLADEVPAGRAPGGLRSRGPPMPVVP
jgi:hypothetical protein